MAPENQTLTPTTEPPFSPPPSSLATMASAGLAAGTTQREDFEGVEISRSAETAASSVAAQATAQIQARYVVALRRPRDWDDVRVRILKECRRPSFADR